MKQNATLDSSFWINAHRSGLTEHVLRRIEIHCAPAVAAELKEEFASGREFWRLLRAGQLKEVIPVNGQVNSFGKGERAAINLALEHPDWLLLIDDRRPLQEAQRQGLPAICSPVLITELAQTGEMELLDALQALARLAALQTVSPALIGVAVTQLAWLQSESERQK